MAEIETYGQCTFTHTPPGDWRVVRCQKTAYHPSGLCSPHLNNQRVRERQETATVPRAAGGESERQEGV